MFVPMRRVKSRSDLVATQSVVCDGIDVVRGDPTIGAGLARFASMWGSAVTALAHELDLLSVELGKSAGDVIAVDREGAR
jgi:hypothetical protein